jgi:hypothetical protein
MPPSRDGWRYCVSFLPLWPPPFRTPFGPQSPGLRKLSVLAPNLHRLPKTLPSGGMGLQCKCSIALFACNPQTVAHLRPNRCLTTSWFRAESRCPGSGRLFYFPQSTPYGRRCVAPRRCPDPSGSGFAASRLARCTCAAEVEPVFLFIPRRRGHARDQHDAYW